jgi:basic amino acid/polyamine antiporter, APA family
MKTVTANRRPSVGTQLPAVLGPWQALGIVVGGTIGASIFLVPSIIAQRISYLGGALLTWIAGAGIALCGALTVSELAAMLPRAGGGYVYIRAALGSGLGFLFAWTDAVLIRAGAAATISFTFGIYFAQILPPPAGISIALWEGAAAVILLAVLTSLNVRGVKAGADVQFVGMIVKALALSSVLILPLLLRHGPSSLTSAPLWPGLHGSWELTGFAAAIIPVMWAYGGWDQVTYLAEEMRNPEKNIPRVLAAGLLILGALYLAVCLGIHYVLPYKVVASSGAVGADVFSVLFGSTGIRVFSLLIVISTVVTANGAVLSAPRSAFAVARDGDAPEWMSRVHPRFQTPANAIVALGCWSAALVAISVAIMLSSPPPYLPALIRRAWIALQQRPLFDVLISYVMFGYLLLQSLIGISLFVLRRRHPQWERPVRVPGYPIVPAASIVATLFLMLAMAESSGLEVIAGLCIILAGWPLRRVLARPASA